MKGKKTRLIQLDYDEDYIVDVYESIEEAATDNWTRPKTIRKALNSDGRIKRHMLRFMPAF